MYNQKKKILNKKYIDKKAYKNFTYLRYFNLSAIFKYYDINCNKILL